MTNAALAEPRANLAELTVSELSASLKRAIEDGFGYVRVRGEIGNVKYHSSGHIYLDLKDEKACLAGIIWRTAAPKIKVKLEAGLEVVVTGRITTYPGQSKYQIVIETLAPAGLGALMALVEERKKKLTAEGLFDPARKQLLPFLPDVIGVVTSPTGAVIRDILHRLEDRFPRRVLVWPVKVQGEGSAEQVTAAIRGFNALPERGPIPRPDLIIVARGGGSLEDLWSFNEENVVRAAAESMIPLVSAIGHETDVTLIDFAADKRAPTPTAAAEMAVPVRSELLAEIDSYGRRALSCWLRGMESRRTELRAAARALPTAENLLAIPRQRLDAAAERLPLALRANAQVHHTDYSRIAARLTPRSVGVLVERRRDRFNAAAGRLGASVRANADAHRLRIGRARERADGLAQRAHRAIRLCLDRSQDRASLLPARAQRGIDLILEAQETRLERSSQLLAALSYQGVLARGFALVRDQNGKPLMSATEMRAGLAIDIELHDGRAQAVVGGATQKVAPEPRRRRRGTIDPGQGSLF